MNKALNTLGMCACARKISYGETLLKNITNKKVFLVVIATDASDNSKKRVINKCEFYKCEYIISLTKQELTKSVGRIDEISSLGIEDINLAKKFKENIER